jgi:hypothetical protein
MIGGTMKNKTIQKFMCTMSLVTFLGGILAGSVSAANPSKDM